jgi:hypothetical protein
MTSKSQGADLYALDLDQTDLAEETGAIPLVQHPSLLSPAAYD